MKLHPTLLRCFFILQLVNRQLQNVVDSFLVLVPARNRKDHHGSARIIRELIARPLALSNTAETLQHSPVRGSIGDEKGLPHACETDRRSFLSRITAGVVILLPAAASSVLLLVPAAASAIEDDLTSKLFNADGSLREDATIQTEARERTLEWKWDVSDQLAVNIDGSNADGTASGGAVRLSYNLPEKWERSSDSDRYMDQSQGSNLPACKRITVYRAPGRATVDRLSKATRIGVARALDVPEYDSLQDLQKADIIGGRSRVAGDDDQKYYEFDLAVAPPNCDMSDDTNLGLGFCPYDSIYLLSATVLEDRLYVICVESDKSEWKRANAELRRVRSSFQVQMA